MSIELSFLICQEQRITTLQKRKKEKKKEIHSNKKGKCAGNFLPSVFVFTITEVSVNRKMYTFSVKNQQKNLYGNKHPSF